MENLQVQEEVLNWFGNADFHDKREFLGSLFSSMTPKELKAIHNLCTHAKRDSKRKADLPQKKPEQDTKRVRRGKDEPAPSKESAPPEPEEPKAWYSAWDLEEIIGLDCEHVHYTDKGLIGVKKIKAATVSLVNGLGRTIYTAKIRHQPGSFAVNRHTREINGFQRNSFISGDCKDAETVKKEVEEKLRGKLVVTHSGTVDFLSLGLNAGDYDKFDIADFYQKWKTNEQGIDVLEKLSLRTLYHKFFNTDLQKGVHSAEIDAKATARVFVKHYMTLEKAKYDKNYRDYNMFHDVVKYDGQ